jgi:hypothetical protein
MFTRRLIGVDLVFQPRFSTGQAGQVLSVADMAEIGTLGCRLSSNRYGYILNSPVRWSLSLSKGRGSVYDVKPANILSRERRILSNTPN